MLLPSKSIAAMDRWYYLQLNKVGTYVKPDREAALRAVGKRKSNKKSKRTETKKYREIAAGCKRLQKLQSDSAKSLKNWRPLGESNPCFRRERPAKTAEFCGNFNSTIHGEQWRKVEGT